MPKFRKKPVVIHAEQLPAGIDTPEKARAWSRIAQWCGSDVTVDALGPCILIDTLEGQMRAEPGNWVVRGVQGEFYPVKPDIFAATYEAVDEEAE